MNMIKRWNVGLAAAGLAGSALLSLPPRPAWASSHEPASEVAGGGPAVPRLSVAYSPAGLLDCVAAYQDYRTAALQSAQARGGAQERMKLEQAAKAWRARCEPARARVVRSRAGAKGAALLEYLKDSRDAEEARERLARLLRS